MYRKPSRLTATIIRIVDCICTAISIFMAFWVRFGADYETVSGVSAESVTALLCGVYLIVSVFVKGKSFYNRGYLDELFSVAAINVLTTVVSIFILFVLHTASRYSRVVFAIYFILVVLTEYISHVILKHLLPALYIRSAGTRNILLVGSRDYIDRYMTNVEDAHNDGVNIIGCCLIDEDCKPVSLSVVCSSDTIEEYCTQNPIDEIYVSLTSQIADGWRDKLNNLVDAGIAVHYEIDMPELSSAAETYIERSNENYYVTYSKKMMSTADIVLKRSTDIIGGLIGSAIAAVLFIFIGPVIKLTSRGPVLFIQDRVGKNGRIIKIAKFRSMVVDAESLKAELQKDNEMDGMMFKMEQDPRITKVGKIIRKTSLDEFPQFFSVLKGDMSLVGTRPPTLDEFEKYNLNQKSRLAFKPGITGLWQVSGRNSIKNFDDIVKLDNQYIREWSFYQDIKILIKTVPAMLSGK